MESKKTVCSHIEVWINLRSLDTLTLILLYVNIVMKSTSNFLEMLFYGKVLNSDTIQLAKKMTKDTRDTSHFDQPSQHTREDPTEYRKDLSKRRIGHRSEHQMFFLLVLQDKCL